MIFQLRAARSFAYALAVSLLVSSISFGQSSSETPVVRDVDLKISTIKVRVDPPAASGPIVTPTVALYFDPVQGSRQLI